MSGLCALSFAPQTNFGDFERTVAGLGFEQICFFSIILLNFKNTKNVMENVLNGLQFNLDTNCDNAVYLVSLVMEEYPNTHDNRQKLLNDNYLI